MTGKDTS